MSVYIKRFILFLCLCLSIASCTSRGYLNLTDQTLQASTPDAKKVAIYVTDEASSTYTVLGAVVVSSDANNDATATVEQLKVQAARLGADAIVNMKLRYSEGFWGLALEASGTAVKLNP